MDNNSVVNSSINKDYISESSSISSVLSDLVNEMRALRISSVEQKEIIQQQQNLIAQHSMVLQQQQGGSTNNHYQRNSNNTSGQYQQQQRPFNEGCYNCGEYGHISRVCPYPPRRKQYQQQQWFNGSGIINGSPNQTSGSTNQVGNTEGGNNSNEAGKDMGHQDIEIDVNAVKRTRGASDDGVVTNRRKKGKERADLGPSQFSHPMFTQASQRQPPISTQQQDLTMADSLVVGKTMKRAREKKPLSSSRVTPPDILKLLNQPSASGVSILQYLAKDRNASKALRENLIAIHRPKARNGGQTVVINELRHGGSSDDDDEESRYSSDYTEDVSSNGSSSFGYSSEEDDIDTVIDYPFDLKKLMNSRPVRTMIAIGDTLLIATVDTGAAISVMSRGLAEKLGLQLVKVNKRFALTGFNDAVSETSLVAKDVALRIGGKLRREHFCIDNSIRDKDVCLLGRTWFTNHSITLNMKENTMIIPTGKSASSFIEVKCMNDYDMDQDEDMENVSTMPVFNVSIQQQDPMQPQSNSDGEVSKKNTLEEVLSDVPLVVQEVVRRNLNTFYEYGGLGRVNNASHEIVTTTNEPIQSKPYRLTVDEEDCLKEELKTLLELDIIRPSDGKYTSPVFFVPKKDGKLRLVVNFQKLNAITVKDGYPLPHIDDILNSIG
ncbi:hypothetical protein G6F42_011752 [Rhizopus arrhizus]|nr:hypothetical protein G6F42_011752 [Rhizopus arrhizus]